MKRMIVHNSIGIQILYTIIVHEILIGVSEDSRGLRYAYVDIYFPDEIVLEAIAIAEESVRLGFRPEVGIYDSDDEEHILVLFRPHVSAEFVRRIIPLDDLQPYMGAITHSGVQIHLPAEAILKPQRVKEFIEFFRLQKTFTLNIVQRELGDRVKVLWATELNTFSMPFDSL